MTKQKVYITSVHRNRLADGAIVIKGYSSDPFSFSEENLLEKTFHEEKSGISFSMKFHKQFAELMVNNGQLVNLSAIDDQGVNFNDGLSIKMVGNQLTVRKLRFLDQMKRVFNNWKQSKNLKEMIFQFAALFYRIIFRRYTIALFADRIDKGNDNAEVLYREVANQRIKKFFIIREGCEDYTRLKHEFHLVAFGSFKHKMLSLIADYMISSHADYFLLNPFLKDKQTFNGFFNYRFIFLQHGVTKDDMSSWLKREEKNIYYLITSSQREADSFLNNSYNYNQNEIKVTGMPRFDQLTQGTPRRKIVFMPTWRAELSGVIDEYTGKYSYNPAFKESGFFAKINAVLASKELDELLKRTGYEFVFVPHPNIIQQAGDFYRSDQINIQTENVDYSQIIQTSSMLITDYSSVAFDFAYADKSVIYYHFDGGNLVPGYFDYEHMGFGPIVHGVPALIDELAKAIEIADEGTAGPYRQRSKDFFMYCDHNNSQRVADLIK